MAKVNTYTFEFKSKSTLPKESPNDDTHSVDVLIDPDGTRKIFSIGFYDFDNRKWYTYEDFINISESMEWGNLFFEK